MGQYPPGSSKQGKCIIRKRAKNFQIVDGILHYKGKKGIRQVVTENKAKRKILEACHKDTVGECHFGRDKNLCKVSVRDAMEEWFHEKCELIPYQVWTNDEFKWYCSKCNF